MTEADRACPQAPAERLLAALCEAHCVRLAAPIPTAVIRLRWEAVIKSMGEPLCGGKDDASGARDGNFRVDVRYDPRSQATFRHSATAQPPHTDHAYHLVPADAELFLCEENAPGGETILIAAVTMARAAQRQDARLYEQMFTLPLPYGKAGQRGRSTTVLQQRPDGLYLN